MVTAAADLGETHITIGASPGAPPKASSEQTDDVREPLRSTNAWGARGGGVVKNSAPDSKFPLEPAGKDPDAKSEVLGEVLGAKSGRRRSTSRSDRRSGSRQRRRSGSRQRRRSGSRRNQNNKAVSKTSIKTEEGFTKKIQASAKKAKRKRSTFLAIGDDQ